MIFCLYVLIDVFLFPVSTFVRRLHFNRLFVQLSSLDKDISEALAVTFPGDDNAVKTILREANKMLL
jgi:hypothetical protein